MNAATLQIAIDRAKREITEDIAAGTIPADVDDFGQLHDHVDANEYGGLCDEPCPYPMDPEAYFEFSSAVQDAVHQWLQEGRP